ncbi:hypothetical protein HU751_022055 [Pseudomonas sp. BW13M1]|uniref:Uncharacterized protein n=1 Tax=Pseudomonas peradeniyensis TaxID=2745488 RepID=A0A923K0B1_9PSED|nr:hypothetical protein [Pseudomonas peradeniyensis]MBV4507521.1 hypothetical protein [Pseudomonas peradeniyensis]
MDIENIKTIAILIGTAVGFVSLLFTTYKIVRDLATSNKSRLKEDYRFAREFLKDLDDKNLHNLAKDRGLYAIAGTDSMNIADITYLLQLSNADRCIKDYTLAYRFVEYDDKRDRISFRKKYQIPSSRRWRKLLYMGGYVFFAMLAILPFWLTSFTIKLLPLAIFTLPSFGLLAAESARNFIKLKRGEALVSEQSKHTELIAIDANRRKTA